MQNKELEFGFLACILKDPENILKSQARSINESYFDIPTCSKLFGITIRYFQAYNVLPTSTDVELVLSSSRYTANLGDDFKKQIAVLFNEVTILSNPPNFDLLLDELIQYHKTNLFQKSLFSATEFLTNNSTEKAIEVVKKSLSSIDKILATNYDLNGNIEENAKKLWNRFQDAESHPEKYQGVKIGYNEFDKITGGLRKGTVTLIMGGWKSGKSVLAMNIAHNVASPNPSKNWTGKRVLYHVNEGLYELNASRLASRVTGINTGKLNLAMQGDVILDKTERDLYEKYLKGDEYKTLRQNLIIDSAPPFVSRASYIAAKIQELQPEFVIIDNLSYMGTDEKINNIRERFIAIASEVVGLAINSRIPILMFGHVNRKGKETSDKKNEDYDAEDFGESIEPIKACDSIVSWRIQDMEQFRQSHKGIGTLAVRDARSTESFKVDLLVDTGKMLVADIVFGGTGGQQL